MSNPIDPNRHRLRQRPDSPIPLRVPYFIQRLFNIIDDHRPIRGRSQFLTRAQPSPVFGALPTYEQAAEQAEANNQPTTWRNPPPPSGPPPSYEETEENPSPLGSMPQPSPSFDPSPAYEEVEGNPSPLGSTPQLPPSSDPPAYEETCI